MSKDRGLNKTDKLLVGRGAQPCAPTENVEVIKFLFLSNVVLFVGTLHVTSLQTKMHPSRQRRL